MFHYQSSYQVNQVCKWYEPPFPYHRRSGRVKFFNVQKGYGFITPFKSYSSNGSKPEEVFVHRSSILTPNSLFEPGLNKGEEVEYELHDGPRGIFALYVTGPKGRPVQYNDYGNRYLLPPQPQQQRHHRYSAKSDPMYRSLYTPYMTYMMPNLYY